MPSIRNVTLARAGHFDISTGPATFTVDQFRDAVAASHDPDVGEGIIRPGHVDPRFDGEPALGHIANMRVEGDRLVGDLMDLPGWLSSRMRASYPNRSIDGWTNVRTQAGKQYKLVVTGLALLGVTAPGIKGLGDLPAAIAASESTQHIAATAAEMGLMARGEVPVPAQRSAGARPIQAATSRDIERAFGETQAGANGAWVVDIDLGASAAIAVDIDGDYYRVPYSIDGEGAITFGTPAKVRLNYVDAPDDEDAAALDAGAVAASSTGSPLAPSSVTNEPGPTGRGGPHMDLATLRTTLGLPDTADEPAVMAELARLRAAAPDPATPPPPPATPPASTPPPPGTPTTVLGATPAGQPAPATPAPSVAGQPVGAPQPADQRVPVMAAALPGTIVVDAEAFRTLQVQAAQGSEAFTRQRASARETFLGRLQSAGKLAPGSKELRASLGTIYDADPAQAEKVAAELPVVLPTSPVGFGGDAVSATDQGLSSPEEAAVWGALVNTSPFLQAAVASENGATNGAAGA